MVCFITCGWGENATFPCDVLFSITSGLSGEKGCFPFDFEMDYVFYG